MQNIDYVIKIKPDFSNVGLVRKEILPFLEELSREIIDSCEIIIWELVTNAIKYGQSRENSEDITVHFSLLKDIIKIEVINPMDPNRGIQTFVNFMDKIKKSEARQELYLSRMKELIKSDTYDKSQLGLYRIIGDTMFELDYEVDGNTLKVKANLELKNE